MKNQVNENNKQNVSIISDDCWAGQFYQMLNLQYLTPTIGLLFQHETYINFLSNLRKEDAFDLKFIQSNADYPIAITPYATIHFLHYQTEHQVKAAFLRRAKRIEWSELFVKIDFGKYGYSQKDIAAWNAMSLPNSIAFYPPNKFGLHPDIHNGVMIPDWVVDGGEMFEVSRQHFDLFHWLEMGEIKLPHPSKLAIVHGEALPSDVHETPATYLQQAVEKLPHGELISLQTDGLCQIQTYSQIWVRSTSILGGLRQELLQPGQCLVLLLYECHDFAAALWSCFMGGFVPVSLQVSANYSQTNHVWLRLTAILEVLDEAIILTTEAIARYLTQHDLQHQCKFIYLEQVETSEPDNLFYPSKPDDLAALYLSSGTTGKPKLASFSCRAIANRLLANQSGNPAENSLYWLPLDHASASLRIASPGIQRKVFLPTERFIEDPLIWLDAITKYQINQTNMTNFGMALITEWIELLSKRHWDLTSIYSIGIGAETIVPKTYRSFLRALIPFGLSPNATSVGYGLTECGTVAGKDISRLPDDRESISLGKPCQGYSIRIVDEQNHLLYEGNIGYVQIKSQAIATGYYGNTRETQLLFTEDGWINTGDLGFIFNQNLTITSRAKEIIIINAKNYSCQEIEQIVKSIPGIEPGFTVACAIRTADSATEELAVFFNTSLNDRDLIRLRNQIRVAILTQLGITPTYFLPLAKDAFPRTATGKIKRVELAKKLEIGEFATLLQYLDRLTEAEQQINSTKAFTDGRDELEIRLIKIWKKVLGSNFISIQDNFFELGGYSFLAVRLFAEIQQEFCVKLPLAALFQSPSIEQLANIMRQEGWKPVCASLVVIQAGSPQPRLFCIHSLGKGLEYYRPLVNHLKRSLPVYGLSTELGVLDQQQAPANRVEDLAAYYIKEMRTLQPEGPYFLVGASFGGFVAFEMARQLHAQGQKIAMLALLDTTAKREAKGLSVGERLSAHLRNFVKLGSAYIWEKIAGLIQQRHQQLLKFYCKLYLKTGRTLPDNLQAFLQISAIIEANFQAGRDYVPQVYPGEVILFKAIKQPNAVNCYVKPGATRKSYIK
jgi:acyl-CoA synthetase (AMP-forming)/AMP-acid ligase II/pimeloyl-ACP methyl ester carboxylesterase/acyl carrier protein